MASTIPIYLKITTTPRQRLPAKVKIGAAALIGNAPNATMNGWGLGQPEIIPAK